MAESGAIRAGRAFVELLADDTKLQAALKRTQAKLQAFGSQVFKVGLAIGTAGVAGITAFAGAAKIYSDTGDALAKMANRTGVSVEALSALQHAAGLSDVSTQALGVGLRNLAIQTSKAGQGSAEAVAAFDSIGLSVAELLAMSPEDRFKAVAEAISKLANSEDRAAAAQKVFGKAGFELIPLLNEGAAGMERMTNEAKKLGLVMSTDDAKAAEELNDALGTMWSVLKRTVVLIGTAVGPTFKRVAEIVTTTVAAINKFIDENREMVVMALYVAAGVAAAGAVILTLGATIIGVGAVLGGLATIIGVVVAAVKVAIAVVGFLLSPIGLVIAGVVALAGYFLYASGVIGDAVTFIAGAFEHVKEVAMASFKGIADAIAAGDIVLAGKILWATLKLLWQEGTNWLWTKWEAFTAGAAELFDAFVVGLLQVWNSVSASFSSAWANVVAFMQTAWNNFVGGFMAAWELAVGWVEKRIHDIMGKLGVYDAEKAKKMVDDRVNYELAKIGEKNMAALDAIEKERKAKLKSIDDAAKAEEAALMNAANSMKERRDKTNKDAQKSREDEIAKTSKELADLIAQAAEARKQNEADAASKVKDVTPASQKQLGVGPTISMGAFGSIAAQLLAQRLPNADRALKAAEDTAKNTKKMADQMGDGLAWGD